MEKTYYEEYAVLETTHWWFRARLEILKEVANRKIIEKECVPLKILNVGVASGATSKMLIQYGDVTSVEYDKECCEYLRNVAKVEVTQASMTELPYADETFDMVCAFDVIEHIEDHKRAVEEAKRVLKPGGHFFATVPAFQFLWTEHDLINHHFRRYDAKLLKSIVDIDGFKIRYFTFFNSLLFPMILMARMISKLLPKSDKPQSDFKKHKASSLINQLLYRLFKLEKLILKVINFPFGVSLMTICQKDLK